MLEMYLDTTEKFDLDTYSQDLHFPLFIRYECSETPGGL